MKTHYCPADKTTISYEGECNWCGEKEMKQEPVAWTDGKFCLSFAESDICPIPLYTAPRELSDEEIRQVWLSLPYDPDNAPYIFARAILKKASEK